MSSSSPPLHAQILVVGGGPAGAYAATALRREGFHVVLFEAASFPRYHVGESLIPSARRHFDFIGVDHKVEAAGFAPKPGAAMKFTQHKSEGYTDFSAMGTVWNVNRAEFDALLLNHARDEGVHVFEDRKVTGIAFNESGRPVSATNVPTSDSDSAGEHTITFDYLVDASGRAGLLSQRYLKTRKYNKALKNAATWGYWRGTGKYGLGTPSEGAPLFEALTDESGWAWFIPLAGGLTSIGVVRDEKAAASSSRRSSLARPQDSALETSHSDFSSPTTSVGSSLLHRTPADSSSTAPSTPDAAPFSEPKYLSPLRTSQLDTDAGGDSPGRGTMQRYLSALKLAPTVQQLLGTHAVLSGLEDTGHAACAAEDSGTDAQVRSASNFSYSASSYAGEGYRIVGDAGAFIDPFFSSGIHLAMTSALAAAASIASSIRGEVPEQEAGVWHTSRVTISYTRFLVVVLSAYKQMRAQSADVLSDVGEDNFERAFRMLRPFIQGSADVDACATEEEVQRALDFCTDLFTVTSSAEHATVRERLSALSTSAAPDAGLPAALPELSNRKRSGTLDRVMTWFKRSAEDGKISEPPQRPALPPRSDSEPAPAPAHVQSKPSINSADALLDVRAPILGAQALAAAAHIVSRTGASGRDAAAGAEDEVRRVLTKVNARRVIHAEHGGLGSLEDEGLGARGLRVRLVRGSLGLVPADGHAGE